MKKCLIVCLLSVTSLTVQCAEEPKKFRKAVSQQIIAIQNQEGKSPLSHSAPTQPVSIPRARLSRENSDQYSPYPQEFLVGSPEKYGANMYIAFGNQSPTKKQKNSFDDSGR